MMRKTLWALALLVVLSGCNDNYGDDTPPKEDRLVNTTFNIEYSLNFDTPSVNYPATNNQQSEIFDGIAEMPVGWTMRFIMELWEEKTTEGDNPEIYYERYHRLVWGTRKHVPVPGEVDKYVLTKTARISKGRYKVLLWADYTRSYKYDEDLGTSVPADYYFGTDYLSPKYKDLYGLRYVLITQAYQRDNYDAFSGTGEIDFTIYEDSAVSYAEETFSVSRVFGKYTLIATGLQEYKDAILPPLTYETNMKPLEVNIDYGGETYEVDDEEFATGGLRSVYDGLNQTSSHFRPEAAFQLEVVAENEEDDEIVLTYDYILANADNAPINEVTMTLIGPMNTKLNKILIGTLPIERNKETFFRAHFLNKVNPGPGDITIIDDFDDGDGPTDIDYPAEPLIP